MRLIAVLYCFGAIWQRSASISVAILAQAISVRKAKAMKAMAMRVRPAKAMRAMAATMGRKDGDNDDDVVDDGKDAGVQKDEQVYGVGKQGIRQSGKISLETLVKKLGKSGNNVGKPGKEVWKIRKKELGRRVHKFGKSEHKLEGRVEKLESRVNKLEDSGKDVGKSGNEFGQQMVQ